MSKSRRLSSAFVPFLLEWRPSRWPGAMLCALVLLAPFSLIASDLPRGVALPFALAAMAWAIFDARRYRLLPVRRLTIPPGRGGADCDGERINALQTRWRGPLAFLSWRDAQGRQQRAAMWTDTLPAGMRRELKIVMQRRDPASEGPSMAG